MNGVAGEINSSSKPAGDPCIPLLIDYICSLEIGGNSLKVPITKSFIIMLL